MIYGFLISRRLSISSVFSVAADRQQNISCRRGTYRRHRTITVQPWIEVNIKFMQLFIIIIM